MLKTVAVGDSVSTLCLKKRTNFETVELKILRINFDEIWQKYSKDSRIEFACFSFHGGLLFYQLFIENNAKFDTVSSKHGNSDAIQ